MNSMTPDDPKDFEPPLVDSPKMFDGVSLRSSRRLEVQHEVLFEVGLGSVLDGTVGSMVV